MREAARLVAKALPNLATSEDPGRPLDAFPRQLDRKDEDAAPLVEALWAALENAEVVPDATGTPRLASDLWRHPRDNADLAQQWASLAKLETLAALVHPLSLKGNRSRRLDVLANRLEKTQAVGALNRPNLRKKEAATWFAAVASVELPGVNSALKLAETYSNDCKPGEWSKDRPTLAIILSHDGQLLTADKVVVAPEGLRVPGRSIIASFLCADDEAKRIAVEVMKVRPPAMRDGALSGQLYVRHPKLFASSSSCETAAGFVFSGAMELRFWRMRFCYPVRWSALTMYPRTRMCWLTLECMERMDRC